MALFGLFNRDTTADANIRVNYDGKGAEKGMKGLMGSVKGLSAAFGGLLVLNKVNSLLQESAQLAKVQIQAERQLESALGRTSQSLLNNAAALQKLTTHGDEEIIQAQAMIAAFVKEEEQIKKLMPRILDLADAKGMNLVSAADLVTKSVSSSTNALARYGIEITGAAGSTERIESAAAALEKAFGGMAEGLAKTDVGKLKQIENTIGDIKEEIGIEVIPLQIAWNKSVVALLKTINLIPNSIKAVQTALGKREDRSEDLFSDDTAEIRAEKLLNIIARLHLFNAKGIEATIDGETRIFRLRELNEMRRLALSEITDAKRKKALDKAFDAQVKRARKARKEAGKEAKEAEDEEIKRLESMNDARKNFILTQAQWEEEHRQQKLQDEKDADDQRIQDMIDRNNREIAEKERRANEEKKIEEELAEEKATIRRNSFNLATATQRAFDVMITASTNRELSELNKSAKNKEDYEKKRTEIMEDAAKKQRSLAVFNQAVSVVNATSNMFAAAAKAGEVGAVAGPIGAIASAGIVIAEFAGLIASISALDMPPEPKFQLGRLGGKKRGRGFDNIPALLDPGETVISAPASAMHDEALRAIQNNTANTARGLNRINGGTTVINNYGISTEQFLQAQVATQRNNQIGRRI